MDQNGSNVAPPIQEERNEKQLKWSEDLCDFLEGLDTYSSTVPESVIKHLLQQGGATIVDPRILKLVGLATDKFLGEIIHEARETAKNRQSTKKRKSDLSTLEMNQEMLWHIPPNYQVIEDSDDENNADNSLFAVASTAFTQFVNWYTGADTAQSGEEIVTKDRNRSISGTKDVKEGHHHHHHHHREKSSSSSNVDSNSPKILTGKSSPTNTTSKKRKKEKFKKITNLIGDSTILTPQQLENIASWLPKAQWEREWTLRYSLLRDGASLETLLNNCIIKDKVGKTIPLPSIILIKDSYEYIFGAYVSHAFENKQSYYGQGENFIFSLQPVVKVYPWTCQNNYFVVSNISNFGIGGGGGGYAIQLDDMLDNGVSNCSDTYLNAQLSHDEMFKCIELEVWSIEELKT